MTTVPNDPTPLRVLGIAGSLRTRSYNRALLRAARELAPDGVRIDTFDLAGIPLYNGDLDRDGERPEAVERFKAAIAEADALLIATPEYNYGIPGVLKNAIDWGSRPYGENAFTRKPSAVIGASPGKIGTAVGQQHLRSILGFCNSPQMNAPEAYIQFTPGLITDDGEVTEPTTEAFLRDYMEELCNIIERVYTVLPRNAS